MTDQIGLHKFKLSQKRYEKGRFYLSLVLDNGQVQAFDGRFVLEEGGGGTPTKNGFRLPIDKLDEFKKALANDLRELDDILLFKNNSFSFHIRYVNDKYGEGVDFRKYKTSEKYTGWARSGIRMKLEDVVTLRDWLSNFDPREVRRDNAAPEQAFARKADNELTDRDIEDSVINPTIRKLLDY